MHKVILELYCTSTG